MTLTLREALYFDAKEVTRELLGGQVAGLAGVTIRTSHHYDEIGLLSPSGRSAVGYRIYEEADLERLQRILFYRELRFTLEEIATIVDDPCTDVVRHLHRQRELLTERTKRLRDGRGYRLRNGGTDDGYTTNAGGAIRGLR